MNAPTCPTCGDALLLVTNRPGGYLCRTCRATVEDLDVEAWRAELTELRDQQRAAAIATMRLWRRDADSK